MPFYHDPVKQIVYSLPDDPSVEPETYKGKHHQWVVSGELTMPARLDVKQTAAILGFQEHDIPVLASLGQLEPLGKPMPNARKYFARVQIMEVADNPTWLSKATKLISQHWVEKNASRTKGSAGTNQEAQ